MELEGTIPLHISDLVINDPNKNIFQLEFNPGGLFSSTKKYQIKTDSESELVNWVIDIKKFIKRDQN